MYFKPCSNLIGFAFGFEVGNKMEKNSSSLFWPVAAGSPAPACSFPSARPFLLFPPGRPSSHAAHSEAAQLAWTSGAAAQAGQARPNTGRARAGASGPDASATSQPSSAQQTGPARRSNGPTQQFPKTEPSAGAGILQKGPRFLFYS